MISALDVGHPPTAGVFVVKDATFSTTPSASRRSTASLFVVGWEGYEFDLRILPQRDDFSSLTSQQAVPPSDEIILTRPFRISNSAAGAGVA